VTVTTAEEKVTGERRDGKLELKSSQVKGGELHGIMAKLEEGLSWIGRSCGGLSMVSGEIAGEEFERRQWI
jgi:hypothetical protein